MRLDIEQAKKYLQGMYRLWLYNEQEQPYSSERCLGCDSHDNSLDIVLLSSGSMSDIAQDLYDTFEAIQQENEQLKADIRGKDNEINDLKAIIEYLRKFKPKKNEAVRKEEVQKQHESTKKLYEQGLTAAPVDIKRMLDLYNTIEALRQENEQLRAQLDEWKYEVQCHMDEVIAREKQIEQLRMRVARMRKLFTKAYDEIEQTLAEIDKVLGEKDNGKTDI